MTEEMQLGHPIVNEENISKVELFLSKFISQTLRIFKLCNFYSFKILDNVFVYILFLCKVVNKNIEHKDFADKSTHG